MHGPDILATFLSKLGPEDKYGQRWQYNSRSDRHSKVGCWGIALDLLSQSALMQRHALDRKIVMGVNHPMRDFKNNREKVLDLVIARPSEEPNPSSATFRTLADQYEIALSAAEARTLTALPTS